MSGAHEECMRVHSHEQIFKGQQWSQKHIGVSSPAETHPSAHRRQRDCQLTRFIYAEITSAGETKLSAVGLQL